MIIISISTTFERIFNISKGQFPNDSNLHYLISCQGDKLHPISYYESYIKSLFDCNFTLITSKDIGLSKNRNLSFKYLNDSDMIFDAIYICDDDVAIIKENLFHANFLMNKLGVDIFCGKILSENAEDFKNKYPLRKSKIHHFNAMRVSSVEMLISPLAVRKSILFDESFGLGTDLPSGEEYIFITDHLKSKSKIIYFPIPFCFHPNITSGLDFFSNENKISAKGKMFKRIFGQCLGGVLSIVFSMKKYREYKKHIGFWKFLEIILISK